MDTRQAYDTWASQYDTNDNRTRDLEAIALRTSLESVPFTSGLEIGCGTGKNTAWFAEKAERVTAVDFSTEMLAKAREKITSEKVAFVQADITREWNFRDGLYDLVSFSLVLEHIENLDHVFREASRSLVEGGHIYVGELHAYKQYAGSKARFETGSGQHVLECFTHHASDFVHAAKKHGLTFADLDEYFDEEDRSGIPRILSLLFRKA